MRLRAATRCLIGFLAIPFLVACEAPLVMDRVEAQRTNPTQRSDRLQAAASNGSALVVVGGAGVVLTSSDGSSWQRQILEGQPFLLDIAACPDGQFVALAYGQQIWVGDQNGTEWRVRPMETYETPQALTCDSRGRVWVVGSFSSILRTDDLGETWIETSLDEDLHFTTIQFVDEQHGFMTGEFGVIVRTTDGGETWENLEPLANEFYPQDAYFQDVETAWVVGLNGTILSTSDGAASWSSEATGTDAPLYSITHYDGQLFVVGAFGTVLRKNSEGSWTRVDHGAPIRFYLRGAVALDANRLLTAGGAGALFVIET
jgi:photosystem II stability/assembly factor-like uncharacterized protein